MGGQSSKAKSAIVTDIIVDVLSTDLLNCSQMISQQQSMDISGSGNVFDGVSMKQAFYIDVKCSQSINRTTDIQNLIAEKVQQAAEAQGEVIVSALGRERSEVVSTIKNKISNSITTQNIMQCATTINNSQTINVSGNNNIVRNVSLEQHGEMVKNCMQKIAEQTKLVNDLKIEENQTASAEEKGLFGWMSSGYGMVVLIVIAIVAGVVIYYVILARSGGPGNKMAMLGPMMGQPNPAQTNIPQYPHQQFTQTNNPQYPHQQFVQTNNPPFNPGYNPAQTAY